MSMKVIKSGSLLGQISFENYQELLGHVKNTAEIYLATSVWHFLFFWHFFLYFCVYQLWILGYHKLILGCAAIYVAQVILDKGHLTASRAPDFLTLQKGESAWPSYMKSWWLDRAFDYFPVKLVRTAGES